MLRTPRHVLPCPAHSPGLRVILTLLVLVWVFASCEEPGDSPTPPGKQGGHPRTQAGQPFPENGDLARVVAETRSILPRIPTPLRNAEALIGDQPASGTSPRRVLVGEARLLRPSAFPLPQRLRVEVFLDDGTPPGGYLRVTGPKGTPARWNLLSGHMTGAREGDFTAVFRVADPQRQLRYLVLLGLEYESDRLTYRSLEGYLIHPAGDGSLSQQGPVYPIDFGYRHPEPPLPVAGAEALKQQIATLNSLYARWLSDAREKGALESKAATLRASKVPPDQATQLKADLAEYGRRIDALAEGARTQLARLRSGLLKVYRDREALTRHWEAFLETNAYRWRTPEARRKAYLPIRALRGSHADLERLFAAVEGESDPAMKEARDLMEQAVLKENEIAPQP